VVDKIAEFLKSNKTIVHLDLSNNIFTFEESQIIAENLNKYN
jgi:hypothetical protein